MSYDPADNSKKGYELACAEMRKKGIADGSIQPYRLKEVIGDCELYLGCAREVVSILSGQFECVVSDPPYGMAFRSNYRAQKHQAIQNDKTADLLQWSCQIPVVHSRYIFCRWDNLLQVPRPRSCITWVKNNWSMGDLEHEHGRQTEIALFYPGPDHCWPKQRPSDVVSAPRTGNEYHPTEKPVGLMQAVVGWTSGTVLDPFMGSGTTGVACANLGRKFIGIEIEEKYFDISCKRIEEAYKQPRLFEEPAPKPVQASLLDGDAA